jgi:hypothetical protein
MRGAVFTIFIDHKGQFTLISIDVMYSMNKVPQYLKFYSPKLYGGEIRVLKLKVTILKYKEDYSENFDIFRKVFIS